MEISCDYAYKCNIYIFLEVWESVANTGLDRATPLISINAENAEED